MHGVLLDASGSQRADCDATSSTSAMESSSRAISRWPCTATRPRGPTTPSSWSSTPRPGSQLGIRANSGARRPSAGRPNQACPVPDQRMRLGLLGVAAQRHGEGQRRSGQGPAGGAAGGLTSAFHHSRSVHLVRLASVSAALGLRVAVLLRCPGPPRAMELPNRPQGEDSHRAPTSCGSRAIDRAGNISHFFAVSLRTILPFTLV